MPRLVPLLLLVAFGALCNARAQTPGGSGAAGEERPAPSLPADTLFIFQPARPLIDSQMVSGSYDDAIGFDLLFSNSGFGFGGFYLRSFSPTLTGFVNIGATGSRNTDELPRWDPEQGRSDVPGKVNRLFTFPLTIGVRQRLFESVLVDNVRPYVNAGVGPSLIVQLPYEYDFLSSIFHARYHVTAGGFVGVGAEVGGSRPILGVNIRYFYIPFARGLESVQGSPITDFGGLFLTLNVGFVR